MSENYIFGCGSCAASSGKKKILWDILVGPGPAVSSGRTRDFLDQIQDYRVRTLAEEYLDQGYQLIKSESPGFRIYFCHYCHQFHERYFFLLQKGDRVITPTYCCSNRDRSPLVPVTLWIRGGRLYVKDDQGHSIQWRCPLCGGDYLSGEKQMVLV